MYGKHFYPCVCEIYVVQSIKLARGVARGTRGSLYLIDLGEINHPLGDSSVRKVIGMNIGIYSTLASSCRFWKVLKLLMPFSRT